MSLLRDETGHTPRTGNFTSQIKLYFQEVLFATCVKSIHSWQTPLQLTLYSPVKIACCCTQDVARGKGKKCQVPLPVRGLPVKSSVK